MPTPTTVYANWTSVKFTPTGGSATTFSRVQSVSFAPGGQLTPYSADGNRFPVAQLNLMNSPSAAMQCDNLAQVASFGPGSVGVFEGILNDAINGAGSGSGAIKFQLINACVQDNPMGGAHAAIAQGNMSFSSFSTDGTTTPLSATVL